MRSPQLPSFSTMFGEHRSHRRVLFRSTEFCFPRMHHSIDLSKKIECITTPHTTSPKNRHISKAQSKNTPTVKLRQSKQCNFIECNRIARRRGRCFEHGGRNLCKKEGCNKCSHRGGFCVGHGGGRRCKMPNCTKSSQVGGKCFVHGGGRRCILESCNRAVRTSRLCPYHMRQR